MPKELDIDAFGEIVDGVLKDEHITMVIELPPGTLDAELHDNVKMGGTMQFYILLHALEAAWKNMLHDLNGYLDMDKKEYVVDGILEMVKGSLMEVGSGT